MLSVITSFYCIACFRTFHDIFSKSFTFQCRHRFKKEIVHFLCKECTSLSSFHPCMWGDQYITVTAMETTAVEEKYIVRWCSAQIVVKQHNHIIWICNVKQKMHGTTQQSRKLGELVSVHGGKGATSTHTNRKRKTRMSARPFLLSICVKVASFPPYMVQYNVWYHANMFGFWKMAGLSCLTFQNLMGICWIGLSESDCMWYCNLCLLLYVLGAACPVEYTVFAMKVCGLF